MKGKVRMTLVVDADLNDGEYLIPEDFVPPFLSAPTPAVVPTPELEAPPAELPQPEAASSSPNVPPPLEEIPLSTAPTITARVKPAASSGFKAGLASFGGMMAAGLLYVQENFGSLTDISLKNVLLIGGGAVLSGLLYFFYRFYKPHIL